MGENGRQDLCRCEFQPRAHGRQDLPGRFRGIVDPQRTVGGLFELQGLVLFGLYLAGMLIMAYNTFKTVSGSNPVDARIPAMTGAHA